MDPVFLEFFRELLAAHPDITMILAAIGLLRAVNKPFFALLRMYVAKTKTQDDDKLLEKVEKSKYYKMFMFALDWFASVKPLKDESSVEKKDK